jgi:signal peptidase I
MLLLALTLLLAAPEGDCSPVEKEINGTSLEGQLFPDQKVMAIPTGCHTPRRLDFVIFTSEESDNLVIKQVWGVPGDMLSVGKRGQVYVNGEQTLTPFDKPYMLKPFFARRLKKLEGPLEGYLALGHPGSLDSGRVGPIPLAQIVGVVPRAAGRGRENP